MSKSNQSCDLFFKSKSGTTFHAVDFKVGDEITAEREHQTAASWTDHFSGMEGVEDGDRKELCFDHA